MPLRAALPVRRRTLRTGAAALARDRFKSLRRLLAGTSRADRQERRMTADPLLEVKRLVKHFPVKRGVILGRTLGQIRAVDDVTFSIGRGETLALVGESGCGKSTTGRLILRLMEPTSGSVRFKGQDIAGLEKSSMRRIRRHMQIIFQDPYASLNPRLTVGETLAEPLSVHGIAEGTAALARVRELLDIVGLLP